MRKEEDSQKRLRKAAEEKLAQKGPESTCTCGTTEEQKLIYELQIHQIELELQNEELVRTQQKAEQLRKQYQTLFEVAPVGYLVLDQNGVILQCNSRAAQLFETADDDLTGKRLGAFLDQQGLAVLNTLFSDLCETHKDKPCEFSSALNNTSVSEQRHLHFFGRVIQSGDPQIHCIVAISDITELHQYQEALRETNKKLHLLSSVTRHDIINQVMALGMGLEFIRMKMVKGEPIDEDLSMCESTRESIEHLIQFTRDYESLGVQKPAWQSVGTIMERVQEKTALPVIIDPSLSTLEVYADLMLPSVFLNLAINAEQHGGEISRITVSYHRDGSEAVLVFEDNGIGIPDDMKNEIFKRGVGEGSGFGLFFSSEILGITSISICESGKPGEGARFELHIPPGVWRCGSEPL